MEKFCFWNFDLVPPHSVSAGPHTRSRSCVDTGEIWLSLLSVIVYTNQVLCINNAEIGDWELFSRVLYFELQAASHISTHTNTMFLCYFLLRKEPHSCKCKDSVHRDLCRSSQNSMRSPFFRCSLYIHDHLVDKDALLPTSSDRRPPLPRLSPRATHQTVRRCCSFSTAAVFIS